MRKTTAERFWGKIDLDGPLLSPYLGRCWLWIAKLDAHGYGTFHNSTGSQRAHRYSYEIRFGPVPSGLVLDHLCRMRHCVNPAHLEPVTDRENMMRGNNAAALRARQRQCKHGHAMTTENVYLWLDKYGRTHRECRLCARERQRLGWPRRVERERLRAAGVDA